MSRRNPFEELESLLERMGRQFEDAAGEWPSGWGSAGSVAVDVVERDDEVVVTADLPGFERETIDIRLAGDTLRIEAHSGTESEAQEGDYVRRERGERSARRTVSLPGPVDEEGVSATYRNGVLTVTLPRPDAG